MQHMKITKAYQFRLYPTKEQEILIHKTFGCTRFLYNQMLEEKKKDKMLSKFDLFKKIPEYIKNYPFLSEVDMKEKTITLSKLKKSLVTTIFFTPTSIPIARFSLITGTSRNILQEGLRELKIA